MNPFLTAAGGSAGAQGPQGAAGASGTPGAQGAQGAQGAAGSGAAGPWDWADPFYEVAGDQLSVVDPALWTDSDDLGGANACTLTQVQGRNMKVDTSGAGNRVQGALIAVPSDDFVRLMRLGFQRNVQALTASSVITAGVAFVDGADVSTSSWYGAHVYWGTDYANAGYTVDQTSGASRWESYDAGTYAVIWGSLPVTSCDCALVRSGTSLTVYWADMRGQLIPIRTWTGISTGAGYVGVRTAVLLGSSDHVDVLVYAYRASLTEVP